MNVTQAAYENIKGVLKGYIKGKNAEERVEAAALDVLNSVSHLLTLQTNHKSGKMGATVMTESASINKNPGSAPRLM